MRSLVKCSIERCAISRCARAAARITSAKLSGSWLVVSIITLILHSLVWILAMTRGGVSADIAFGWGIHLWLITVPITLAWSGIATLIGSQFKSPILSLLVTFAIFFVLFVLGLIGLVSASVWIGYVYPNTFEDWMLSPHSDRVAYGAAACAALGIITAAAGTFLFSRKDV